MSHQDSSKLELQKIYKTNQNKPQYEHDEQLLDKSPNSHKSSFQFQIYSPNRLLHPQQVQHILRNSRIDHQPQQQPAIEDSYIYPQESQYCWPKFLQCLGSWCTPCKILCPCICCSCCICSFPPLFKQEVKSAGVLQNWGKFQRILSPGLHVINPVSQGIIQVNLQTKLLQYQQICLTKDNVQFTIEMVVFYRIFNSLHLIYRLGVQQAYAAECIKEMSMGVVRTVVGENLLQAVIDNRSIISQSCQKQLNSRMNRWGIYIEAISLKDIEITLQKQLQEILSQVAKTKRESQAMLINFRAEVECGKLMKEVSEIINNQASYQIRYLNVISQMMMKAGGEPNIIMIKTNIDEDKFNNLDHKSNSKPNH